MSADNGPDPNAPALALNDRQGNARVFETVDTQSGTPSVTLRDPDGTGRVMLSTGPNIASNVRLLDSSGTARITLNTGGADGASPVSDYIAFSDEQGSRVAQLGTAGVAYPEDRSVLHLDDQAGIARVVIAVAVDGTPSIQLFDANGNVTWSAQ
jgi:hypothetical protein